MNISIYLHGASLRGIPPTSHSRNSNPRDTHVRCSLRFQRRETLVDQPLTQLIQHRSSFSPHILTDPLPNQARHSQWLRSLITFSDSFPFRFRHSATGPRHCTCFAAASHANLLITPRRDGREAEGGGLLNRYRVKSSIEGSNPSLSANRFCKCFPRIKFLYHPLNNQLFTIFY